MGLNKVIEFFKNKFQVLKDKNKVESKHYFRLNHIFSYKDFRAGSASVTSSVFDEFTVPENMSYEDSFKVLSFLIEKTSRDLKLRHKSLENIKITNSILEKYHFVRPNFPVHKNDICELYIETGNNPLESIEKRNTYFDEHEWYKYYTKQDEIKEIYEKLGLEVDFEPLDKSMHATAKRPKYQQIIVDPFHKTKTM